MDKKEIAIFSSIIIGGILFVASVLFLTGNKEAPRQEINHNNYAEKKYDSRINNTNN